MKAVVIETGSKHSVLMTPQGEFVRVKTMPHYKVGSEVDFSRAAGINQWIKYAAAAAVFIFCIGILGFIYAYATPYSYVNLDINPSVEIAVNIFDYIIDVKGINADGDSLISRKSVINKPLKDGVDILLDRLDQEAYLPSEGQSTLVFTIASRDQRKADRFDTAIGDIINEKLPDRNKVDVYIIHTDLRTHSDAEKYNVSSGRYLLIQELQKKADNELNPAEMKDVPISQIVDMVREKSPELIDNENSHDGQGLLRPITAQGKQNKERPNNGQNKNNEQKQNSGQRNDQKERQQNSEQNAGQRQEQKDLRKNQRQQEKQLEKQQEKQQEKRQEKQQRQDD